MSDQRQAWVPTVMDERTLKLYGAHPLAEGAFKPEFAIKWIQKTNAFSIKVSTGTKTEKGFPISIETAIAAMPLMELMELIDTVSKSPGAVSFEMDNWGQPFIWDNTQKKSIRSPDIINVSRFQVAKREDGSMVLSVAAKGKKELEFEFSGSDFHRILKAGEAHKAMASRVAAVAWAGFWKKFAYDKYTTTWQETEYDKSKRLERAAKALEKSGGRGGYGGGGGGGQRPPQPQQQQRPQAPAPAPAPQGDFDSFDDDIPF